MQDKFGWIFFVCILIGLIGVGLYLVNPRTLFPPPSSNGIMPVPTTTTITISENISIESSCSRDDDCAPCSNSECANVNYLETADCPGNRCGTYIKECKCIHNTCVAITGNYFTDRGQEIRC